MKKGTKKAKKPKKQVTIDDGKLVDSEEQCEYIIIPPDGGWGWVVVFVSFFTLTIIDGVVFTSGIFFEEIALNLNTSITMVSLSSSILCGTYFLFGPFTCAITNRLGFRFTCVIGGILGFIGLLSASFVDKDYLFIITHGFCCGLSFSILSLCQILSVGFYFEKWRPLAMAITVSGTAFGTILFPLIFKILLQKYDWRLKFRILSGGLLLITIVSLAHRPIKPIKIILEDKKGFDESTSSIMVSDDNPKSVFYKKHNATYPTNADVISQSAYTLQFPKNVRSGLILDSAGPSTSVSKSSMPSYKTWHPKYSMSSVYSERMGVIPEEGFKKNISKKPKCKCTCCECCKKLCKCHFQEYRPMYKDDILFTGSVNVLPDQYRTKMEQGASNVDYHMSVTRITTIKDKEESGKCCICCPESVKRTLATMLDYKLLQRCSFSILVWSGFFTYVGMLVPYTYTIEYAKRGGSSETYINWIIPCIGLSNGIGRVGTGLMCFIPRLDAILITEIAFIFSGISVVIVVFYNNIYFIYACMAIFGCTISVVSSLRPIIAVEMVGLENLTNAFGLIVLFEGISSLTALPLASIINEKTNSFKITFIIAGISILISGLILIPVKKIMRHEKKKKEEKEKAEKLRKLEEAKRKFDMTDKKKFTRP